MELCDGDGEGVRVRLAEEELRIVLVGLLDVACSRDSLDRTDEDERRFQYRVGIERLAIVGVAERIECAMGHGRRARGGWAEVDCVVTAALNGRFELTMSSGVLRAVVAALNMFVNDFDPQDWEFSILYGFHRSEVRAVLHALHLLAVCADRDFAEFLEGGGGALALAIERARTTPQIVRLTPAPRSEGNDD